MSAIDTTTFDAMIGKTMVTVSGCQAGSEEMELISDDGCHRFRFCHYQDCCESVCIEDVCGDPSDLIGAPLLVAEEATVEPEPYCGSESYTWTFYRFATVKGTVTVRWLGESNGYYSEGVSFEHFNSEAD